MLHAASVTTDTVRIDVSNQAQHSVLIVDDAADVRWLLATAFQRAGFETDVAERGSEAVRLIERNGKRYCCVLLDLNIPPPDGLDIAKLIRDKFSTLPVIVISGYPDMIDRVNQAELRAIVRLVVMKPVQPQVLIDYVRAGGDCVRNHSAPAD